MEIEPPSRPFTVSFFALGALGIVGGAVLWVISYNDWKQKNKPSEVPMNSTQFADLGDLMRYALTGACDAVDEPCLCPQCKQPLTGSGPFVTVEGQLWHPAHACCRHCAFENVQQGPQVLVHRGDSEPEVLCGRHYAEETMAVQCAACSKALVHGQPTAVTDMGDVVCANHSTAQQCYSCRRPLLGEFATGALSYADGRQVCGNCTGSAVNDPEFANLISEDIRYMLGTDFGLDTGGMALKIDLGELDEGRRIYEESSNAPGGVSIGHVCIEGMTLQKYFAVQVGPKLVQKREVKGVYLLQGMSRVHAAKVLAHELTHVYLAKNKYFNLPLEVEEGVCQLVAYLWLAEQVDRVLDQSSSNPRRRAGGRARETDGVEPIRIISTEDELKEALGHMRRMESDMSAVYGQGFRKAYGALQGRRLEELLSHIKQHKEFPSVLVKGNHGQSPQFLAGGGSGPDSSSLGPATPMQPVDPTVQSIPDFRV